MSIKYGIATATFAICLICGAERVVAVLPTCAKMIPAAGYSEAREAKSLLLNDVDAIGWRHTKWDVDMAVSADMFLSVGLPEENRLISEVRNIKPDFKIVDVGMGLRKIDGNPYFFMSSDNLDAIRANIWKTFNYDQTIICGPPKTAPSILRPHFEKRSYVVAIAHQAFQYECESCGVATVLLDVDRLKNDVDYSEGMATRLKKNRVNILLSLPGRARVSREFLVKARMRIVEFDLFDGRLNKLAGVLLDSMFRRDSDIEKCEDLEMMQAEVLLSAVRFKRFEVPEAETVQYALDRLQSAVDASDRIDLPMEKRMLKIDFSQVPETTGKVIGHFVLENVSGVEVLSEVCKKVNCRFTECSHATCNGDDFGVLYVVRNFSTSQSTRMEDVE